MTAYNISQMAEKPLRQRRSRRQIAALRFLSNISLDGSLPFIKQECERSNSDMSRARFMSFMAPSQTLLHSDIPIVKRAINERSKSLSLQDKHSNPCEYTRHITEWGCVSGNFYKRYVGSDRSQCIAISGEGLGYNKLVKRVPTLTRCFCCSILSAFVISSNFIITC